MTMNRDPRTMSREELVAYFDGGGDISELLREATSGPDLGPAPTPTPESVSMIVTGVRLSSIAVRQLDELAGNSKGAAPASSAKRSTNSSPGTPTKRPELASGTRIAP